MNFKYGYLEPTTSDEISKEVSSLLKKGGLYHLTYCYNGDELIDKEEYITVEGDSVVIAKLAEDLVKNNETLIMFKSLSLTSDFSFRHFVIHPVEEKETDESQESA